MSQAKRNTRHYLNQLNALFNRCYDVKGHEIEAGDFISTIQIALIIAIRE